MRSVGKTLSFLGCLFSLFLFEGCHQRPRIEVKHAKVGDVELAYYTRGQGEPLVMIMGFRGTMVAWDPALLELLEKHFTLIVFDNRGIGLSSDTKQNLTTIAQMADDTAQLVKELGYQKVHVLGWSMGSRIALELAFRHPDIVHDLVLCSPNPGGAHQAPRKSHSYAALTSNKTSQEEALSLIFPDTTAGHEASAAFVVRVTEAIATGAVPNDLHVTQQTIERQVHALKLWDADGHIYDGLPNLHIPTLVAGGAADGLDPTDNVRIIADRIPKAWSAYFPGAGHNFLAQYHQQFGELVTLFIETNKATEN